MVTDTRFKEAEAIFANGWKYDSFFDAFTTQARVDVWKSNVKKMSKISVLGDKSILPIRDYLVWLINNTAAEAK